MRLNSSFNNGDGRKELSSGKPFHAHAATFIPVSNKNEMSPDLDRIND
jgi:hypothetical protein